ncbi:DUF885 domain-containing protein [Glacieibacterium megasporae]|uniref:DUF885 domain-containing protein n=1 Tax=Glacieibacterium megasporae TaxID=2835787 RepID=UPI001C1E76FB|nr:DUF885 family protein [Polymorphobacter megasporae]UAJ09338.1 DUF885 family protein [Polymorphobacter megasporae]
MTKTVIDRRTMLLAGGATVAAAALPQAAWAAVAGDAGDKLARELDVFADEILALAPEMATGLGVDNGARIALKSELSDISPAANARWAAQAVAMKRRLGAIDRSRLDEAAKIRLDTVMYSSERAIDGTKFAYGGGAKSGFLGGAQPYAISQQDGALSSVPEFLDSQHIVKTRADAEAYLARVSAFAKQLDGETDKIARNAAIGVIPPSFVASNVIGQQRGFRATPAASQRLVASLATRAKAAGIDGDWAGRCTAIVEREVYPALDRQIAAFAKSTAHAPDVGSIQRLPDGDAFYRYALRLGTTTELSPAEIHRTGLEQNKMLQSRMDSILKSQGMTQGSVGARVAALNTDPRFAFPDNAEGRAAIIAYCNERLAKIRKLLPEMSNLGLRADVMVKQVPADIQDGAALGYMNPAALDGSRPAIYYINLKSTALWPKYQLSTLTAHEGVPGHGFQFAYLAEAKVKPPLITSLTGFNAFVEGWALYAEQLVDELGLYADDPFGQLGYLQAQQFRACRLVVDTGLHSMRWTREQAVVFLTSETGKGKQAMTSEVDRYCVAPGQACGYKIGHNEILRLRAKAKAALGPKFTLAGFDDAVVMTGGVPLTVLATAIDSYIAAARG